MEKRMRVKSGIPGLDKLIGGGFNRGSIIVISGETGSGRTSFAMQFLVKGALESKEPGLFISFEEHKRPMYANMRTYGWDLAALERDKLLVFIEYPSHEVEHFLTQEGTIRDLVDAMGIERVVIDSITPIALSYANEDERRKGLIKLVERMRKWGCTILITAEDAGESSQGLLRTKFGIETLADGYIHLYNILKGNKRERGIEIVKMRGTVHETRLVPLEITSKGIVIYPDKKFE